MSFHLSTDKPPTCPMIQLFGNSAGHCGAMPKLGEPTEPGAGYTSGAALLRTVLARNAIANTSVAHRPRPVSSLVRSTLNMFPWISIHPPGKMVLMTELPRKKVELSSIKSYTVSEEISKHQANTTCPPKRQSGVPKSGWSSGKLRHGCSVATARGE